MGTVSEVPYEFQIGDVVLADGTYCLRAEAEDDRGGTSMSCSVCVSVVTPALRYRLDDLGTLLEAKQSLANAINDRGIVVGDFRDLNEADRHFRAFSHLLFGPEHSSLPLPGEAFEGAGPRSRWHARISVALTERVGGFLAARYQHLGTFSETVEGRRLEIDFRAAVTTTIGIAYSF